MEVRRTCLLLFGWLAPVAVLAAPQLRVGLAPLVIKPRTAGPIPVEVRLRWSGARLLEGRLELEFHDGNRVLGRYRSAEMALTTGEQAMRLLLPPLTATYDPQVEVRVSFLAGSDRYTMDSQFLFVPVASERSLVVAVCAARTEPTQRDRDIQQSLRLERFQPSSGVSPPDRKMVTTMALLTPEDLPTQPLAYCAYDVVVLAAGTLGAARERQLEALGRWVEAGGSLCVFGAHDASPEGLRLVTRLARREARTRTDASDTDAGSGIALSHSGTGRCVLVPTIEPNVDLDSATWREAVAFLWKVRKSVADDIVRQGRWTVPTVSGGSGRNSTEYSIRAVAAPGYAVDISHHSSEMVSHLMPRTVRMVPFLWVAALLVLFVLLIGPVDWWVLGWCKRRKYTWVLFPLVAAGITASMVLLANRALGQRDHRRALIVVDVGPGGVPLRCDRYELIFAGRDRSAVAELRGAFWAPLDASASRQFEYDYRYGPPGFRRGADGTDEPQTWEGTLPGHFRVSRRVRQWEPNLSRAFAIAPTGIPSLPVRWDAFDAYMHSEGASRDPPVGSSRDLLRSFIQDPVHPIDVFVFGKPGLGTSLDSGLLPEPLVRQLCTADDGGLFAVVSQLSPTGGANTEDLAVYDPSDRAQCQVGVVSQAQDDIVVYRRLYHGQ